MGLAAIARPVKASGRSAVPAPDRQPTGVADWTNQAEFTKDGVFPASAGVGEGSDTGGGMRPSSCTATADARIR